MLVRIKNTEEKIANKCYSFTCHSLEIVSGQYMNIKLPLPNVFIQLTNSNPIQFILSNIHMYFPNISQYMCHLLLTAHTCQVLNSGY